jgi:hypothetical protein
MLANDPQPEQAVAATAGATNGAGPTKKDLSSRRTARIAGVLFLITFVASIPAVILSAPVLHHANYIVGAGADTRVRFGALLEIILAIAGIGTAVTLFPILKRQTKASPLAMSLVVSLNPPSSSSASSASSRS